MAAYSNQRVAAIIVKILSGSLLSYRLNINTNV